MQNRRAITTPGLVPDQYTRTGDFSHGTTIIYNPATDKPYAQLAVDVGPAPSATSGEAVMGQC